MKAYDHNGQHVHDLTADGHSGGAFCTVELTNDKQVSHTIVIESTHFTILGQVQKPAPMFSLFVISRPSLKMPLPAFYADHLSATLPFLQTANRYPHFSCKWFLAHAKGFPVRPDAVGLSIVKETIKFIQEICHWHTVELCQPFHFLRFNMLCKAFFDSLVNTMGHSHLVRNLHLHQALAMSAPAEPVRDTFNFFISAIPLIELSGLQNLPWGAQYETVYV